MELFTNFDGATKAVDGSGPIGSTVETISAVVQGEFPEAGANAAGLAFDLASAAADPFGALLEAGIGWAMEHIGPLKEILDWVSGDDGEVKKGVLAWHTVSEEIKQMAQDTKKELDAQIGGWSGDAQVAFKEHMELVGTSLLQISSEAEATSQGAASLGHGMSVLRAIVRDTISIVIAEIIKAMVAAGLTAFFTFGASIAAGVSWVIARVGMAVSKLMKLVTKFLRACKGVNNVLSTIIQNMAKAASKIKGLGGLGKYSRSGFDLSKSVSQTNQSLLRGLRGNRGDQIPRLDGLRTDYGDAARYAKDTGKEVGLDYLATAPAKIALEGTKAGVKDEFSVENIKEDEQKGWWEK
ncbi:hypothetical protein JOF53_007175 [Crossiella equi]|uniref:WXG100 family type VII secretion target n=1 Tax=Crossiella equi TaxID=130796 RepID=A0ABS5ANZ8_9PSEU|nr:hypothetical protein [Crossiella equi]MBP2478303.1 hypothetical protein [Crossiella equi]